ncbi:hypothetical protein [Desulfocicer niacini]
MKPQGTLIFRARWVKPKGVPVTAIEKICNEITVNFSIGKRNQPGGSASLALEMLEPYDGRLSRTVLRGERGWKAPDLPDSKGPWKALEDLCGFAFFFYKICGLRPVEKPIND